MPDPVTGIVAGGSIIGAGMQHSQARRAQRGAEAAQAAELDFARQQYADWQKTFGPLQDNLAKYYNNLTPDTIASRGLQAIEQERATAIDRLGQHLAQRGLTGSGLEAATMADIEMQTAEQKANVRATAPSMAAQERMSFLSLGHGVNPAGMMQNVLSGQAQQRTGFANQMMQASGQATAAAVTTAGTALADYFGGK